MLLGQQLGTATPTLAIRPQDGCAAMAWLVWSGGSDAG
jgi:hypothetical protein